MIFNNEKNKLQKIENSQQDIDNTAFLKTNKSFNLLNTTTSFCTAKILAETDYTSFSSTRVGLVNPDSINTGRAIISSIVSFSGTIHILDKFIPYISLKIIVKPIPDAEIVNLLTYDMYGWEEPYLTTTLEPGVFIYNEDPFEYLGSTGADGVVISALLPPIPGKFISSGISTLFLNYIPYSFVKVSDNEWTYRIHQVVGMKVKPSFNVGKIFYEGTYVYTVRTANGLGVPTSYWRKDNTIPVLHDAYRAYTYDIEAKLMIGYSPHQIQNVNNQNIL